MWFFVKYVGVKEERNFFNDTLNTFYLWLYSIKDMVKDHSEASEETHCQHLMGYSFQLAVRNQLQAPSHRQDNTYHNLCYTNREHWLEQEIP